MARSLPLYYKMDQESHTVADTDETTPVVMEYGSDKTLPGGVLLRGCVMNNDGTGQKITVRVYAAASNVDLRYEVELDFTSTNDASDLLDVGIPIMTTPYWSVQADGGTDDLLLRFYVQALSAIT